WSDAAVRRDGHIQQLVMASDGSGHVLWLVLPQRRRSLDVGEEERDGSRRKRERPGCPVGRHSRIPPRQRIRRHGAKCPPIVLREHPPRGGETDPASASLCT